MLSVLMLSVSSRQYSLKQSRHWQSESGSLADKLEDRDRDSLLENAYESDTHLKRAPALLLAYYLTPVVFVYESSSRRCVKQSTVVTNEICQRFLHTRLQSPQQSDVIIPNHMTQPDLLSFFCYMCSFVRAGLFVCVHIYECERKTRRVSMNPLLGRVGTETCKNTLPRIKRMP